MRTTRLDRTWSGTTGRLRPDSPANWAVGSRGSEDVVQQAVVVLCLGHQRGRPPLPAPAIGQVARALSIGDCDLDGSTRRALVLTRAAAWVELRQFPEAEADLQAVVSEAEDDADVACVARARSVAPRSPG